MHFSVTVIARSVNPRTLPSKIEVSFVRFGKGKLIISLQESQPHASLSQKYSTDGTKPPYMKDTWRITWENNLTAHRQTTV